MITAKIIADSTNWLGKRLTTFILEYPRYIHSELMTHRVFSKNSASSRAIPIEKVIADIKANPTKPIWTENQKGMQGTLVTSEGLIETYNQIWYEQRDISCETALKLSELGVHKQNVNRLLEPWFHMRIILTGTEFDNWFTLRDHKDAQPEIAVLALSMREAMEKSTPKHLEIGEWHIPFSEDMPLDEIIKRSYNLLSASTGWKVEPTKRELAKHCTSTLLKISTARCARVSYLNVDGSNSTINKDLELYARLVGSDPKHLSPTEHLAKVPSKEELKYFSTGYAWTTPDEGSIMYYRVGKYFSNLNGWIQYRKLVESKEMS